MIRIACLTGCKTCKNDTRCTECFYPLSLKYLKSTGVDTCVSDCGLRYYATPNRVCNPCDFRCLTCSDSTANTCPDCDYAAEGVTKTGPLSCDCSDGYSVNTIIGACVSNFVAGSNANV